MIDIVARKLAHAQESLRADDIAGAESLLREVLAHDADQADALYTLARIELRSGREAEAIPLLRRLLGRHPRAAAAHAELAAALQSAGENEEAVASARRALAIDPNLLLAHNALGNGLRALGRAAEAVGAFRSALKLDPSRAELHLNLAAGLRDAGRADDALAACDRALAIDPGSAEAHYLRGTVLRALGRRDEAGASLFQAIDLRPDYAEALNAAGNLLVDAGEPAIAEASYRRALAANPGYSEALYNLGCLLEDERPDEAREQLAAAAAAAPGFVDAHVRLGRIAARAARHEEALAHYSRAAALRPEAAALHCGRGAALRALGRSGEAEAAFLAAAAADEGSAEAWYGLSTVSLDQDRFAEGIDRAWRALAADPSLADARWNIGQALLAQGDFARGWRFHEERLHKRNASELAFPFPLWDGTPMPGGTLFVTAEQGVGDEVLFASCIPDLAGLARRVVLECDARLVPLFARSFPGVEPIARLASAEAYPGDRPRPDARVAIGSLPAIFRDDASRFPERASYLTPDPSRVAAWRARFAALGDGLKVGISWRGGKEALVRRARSIPLVEWRALADLPVQFVNLQYGEVAEEIAAARRDAGLVVHDWDDADPLADLDGLAAQLAALDLVVSVDNATVHLAGALGVPAWVMLPATADWRWQRERDDSPWYRSVRLFRQRRPGDWPGVFAQVRSALAERTGAPAAAREREPAATPAAPRVAPARVARRPWVVLLNDTSYWYHWGCTGTSGAMIATLEARGYAVDRVPITATYRLDGVPESLAAWDDASVFGRFAERNAWLVRALRGADHVVIHGEGTLHGGGAAARHLLYLAWIAKRRLGRDVQIVNHSCYPPDDPALRGIYETVYAAMDFVALREPESVRRMKAAGLAAVESFDCLPLAIAADPPRIERQTDEIVLAGSVALRERDLATLAAFASENGRAGHRVRVLLGANQFPAAEDRAFAEALAARAPDSFEVVNAASLGEWLATIARAALVVSGRFHHTIAAATLGTPFVLLDSNTPKNQGLAEALGAPAPLALDDPQFAAKLAERAAEAGTGRGAIGVDEARTRAARLCERALHNFDALPPCRSAEEREPAEARGLWP